MPRAKRPREEPPAEPAAAAAAAPAASAARAPPPPPPPRRQAAAAAPPVPSSSSSDDDTDDTDDTGDASDGAAAPAPAANDALARQVFVEGLPYTSTEADIAQFFDGCGAIDGIKAPRWQDTGRLRGYAHVTFASAAGARRALERDGRYLGDRFINVARAKPANGGAAAAAAVASRPRPAGCTTLFVGNLPYECDEESVRAAFAPFGSIASVRLTRWNNTGRLKGIGYVQFNVALSCEAAMKAYRRGLEGGGGGGVRVGARLVTLDYDTAGPKQSFKTAAGQSFFKTDEAEAVKRQLAKQAARPAASAPGSGAAEKKARR